MRSINRALALLKPFIGLIPWLLASHSKRYMHPHHFQTCFLRHSLDRKTRGTRGLALVAMVCSSSGGLRSFVAVAALCALSSSGTLAVRAETSDIGSIAVESQGDCGLSDGDKGFGIRAITDLTCAGGGLGCYDDHCRYCKVLDTLKSAHLESCEALGVSFPTMAPLTVSAGPCNVSSGDAAVGVAGMTDPSCLYGGIGCFSDHCRFCQTEATPQSSQFVSCSWSYDSALGSGDTGDVNFVLVNSDEYKSESVQATISSSNSEDEEAFEAGVVSVCTSTATDGDLAVGINITTDASCASGGIGCIDSICRFCRTRNTTQSAHLDACPVVTKVCTTTVSAGDAAVGINIISDVSCATGGVGCIDDVCRFCKVRTTEQSAQFQDCSKFVATTTPSCSQVVSDGDAAVGINIVTDTTCANGGLGCIDSVCRFCRVATTTQSASYVACALIRSSTSSTQAPAATTSAPTTAPTTAPAPVATVATPAPTATKQSCSQTVSEGDAGVGINIVTDSSCAYGGLGCIDQVCRFCRVTTSAQSASFIDCAAVTGTTTSSPITAAPTTPPAATTAAPTTAPPTTVPPTTAPLTATPTTTSATSTTPSIVFECYRTVSSGDKGVGLDIVSDIRCSDGGAGCLDDVCRFCKRFDTVQSQSYINCSSIPSANVGADITFVPIPIVNDSETPSRLLLSATGNDPASNSSNSSTTTDELHESLESTSASICTTTVSAGDAAVGINIVADTSCSNGGTGCIDNICRYCKTTDTIQSAHLNSCPTSTTTTTTTTTSTSVSTTTSASTTASKTCAITVSDGDAAVGIGVITDVTCASGGLGCMDSVCRLCKTKLTDQSAHLGSCSDYSTTPTSSPTTTTPATTAATSSPTVTPTTAPVSTAPAYSIPLDCFQTASSGDKSLGLDIVTDIRCGDGGVGCVDSICRFCKRFETTQSRSYMNCADIPSTDNGTDINFKAIAVVDDTQETTSTDMIVAVHEAAEISSDPEEACANVSLADGQAAGGIGVVLDILHCPEGLASGCIGDLGCRYCMRFPTNISDYLEYCEVVNASDVAYALSGEGITSVDESNSLSVEEGRLLSVEVTDNISAHDNPQTSDGVKLFDKGTSEYVVGAVVCIGTVIVVGLAAFGVKRTVKTLTRTNNCEVDTSPSDENRPSVLITSNVGEPGTVGDV